VDTSRSGQMGTGTPATEPLALQHFDWATTEGSIQSEGGHSLTQGMCTRSRRAASAGQDICAQGDVIRKHPAGPIHRVDLFAAGWNSVWGHIAS